MEKEVKIGIGKKLKKKLDWQIISKKKDYDAHIWALVHNLEAVLDFAEKHPKAHEKFRKIYQKIREDFLKPKVLCVCAKGLNRSPYLASYLKDKGYQTRYGGIENFPGERSKRKPKLIHQKDVDWADTIIIIRKRLTPLFKKRFRYGDKKIIVIDVTDLKRFIPQKFADLKEKNWKEFDQKWTYPQLRKAIQPYLPLRK